MCLVFDEDETNIDERVVPTVSMYLEKEGSIGRYLLRRVECMLLHADRHAITAE